MSEVRGFEWLANVGAGAAGVLAGLIAGVKTNRSDIASLHDDIKEIKEDVKALRKESTDTRERIARIEG